MESVLKPKFLIAVGVLACVAAIGCIRSEYALSVFRSTALLMIGLSVPVYAGYRLTANPWFRRIAIALPVAAIIMWLINSDLAAYPLR
ncbi:hypothetical protein HX878_20575 [Pseudomonas veronii]|uniref:hypothetical protein n=1 Tax=Pseudomonas veronii TaxID=76761 RepID=UPI0015A0E996|nr:hypothetical protein [Pseudomonas veronii]NWD57129.1 hypothetical protein [Pseudomonas veronii]